MKTYTIYGNCQGEALAEILESSPNFHKHYQLIKIKPVQLIEPHELDTILNEVVAEVDLFIYQPIADTFRNNALYSAINFLKHTKSKCRTISFPSCYFRGYHPELCFFKNQEGRNIQVPIHRHGDFLRICMMHDLNIIKGFVEDQSVFETSTKIVDEEFYNPQFLAQNLQETLSELRKRESNLNVDIVLSNFIERQFKAKKLFHSFNHPSKHVFLYLGACILRFLNMKPSFIDAQDSLDDLSFPIYNSTFKYLNFDFSNNFKYQVTNQELEVKDMVEQYYQAYKFLPREILEKRVTNWNPSQRKIPVFV